MSPPLFAARLKLQLVGMHITLIPLAPCIARGL
nr:MAG TPA: hypothetical protein [Caudoviricetes sp.]